MTSAILERLTVVSAAKPRFVQQVLYRGGYPQTKSFGKNDTIFGMFNGAAPAFPRGYHRPSLYPPSIVGYGRMFRSVLGESGFLGDLYPRGTF